VQQTVPPAVPDGDDTAAAAPLEPGPGLHRDPKPSVVSLDRDDPDALDTEERVAAGTSLAGVDAGDVGGSTVGSSGEIGLLRR
jgi:hypothetical protein